jgi:hypothetical protein
LSAFFAPGAQRPHVSPWRAGPGNDNDTGPEPELPSIRELLNRHRRRLARSGELPSLKEIELLLKLERQLEAQEELEHLNALTREVG